MILITQCQPCEPAYGMPCCRQCITPSGKTYRTYYRRTMAVNKRDLEGIAMLTPGCTCCSAISGPIVPSTYCWTPSGGGDWQCVQVPNDAADLDGDGDTDLYDYALLQRRAWATETIEVECEP